MRQAFAGHAVVQAVLPLRRRAVADGDPGQPAAARRRLQGRNGGWRHLDNHDVISMPDPWEYPWYAAWDLAFHCVALAHLDPAFAKEQLILLCREWYMHPNGQLPAYEWNFSDVNPPVQAWAALRVFEIDLAARRRGDPDAEPDLDFLERIFHKLLLNFTWWVNRKDAAGQQRVRGRLPRPGQHRPVRPLQAAAGRGSPRAVRRHGLDGDVLPRPAGAWR